MRKVFNKAWGVIALTALLGGCTSLSERILGLEEGKSPTKVMYDCLKSFDDLDKQKEAAKDQENFEKFEELKKKSGVNEFLDCVFEITVAEDNLELRLVRGHAIVSILGIYGAWSAQFDAGHMKDDAARILSRIEKSEQLLWAASQYKATKSSQTIPNGTTTTTTTTFNRATTKDARDKQNDLNAKLKQHKALLDFIRKNNIRKKEGLPPLPESQKPKATPVNPGDLLTAEPSKIRRIVTVSQVLTAVSKPAARRTRSLITKVFSLITAGTPTPTSVLSTAKELRKTIKRALTVKIYGSAYLGAVRSTLLNIHVRDNSFPTFKDWKAIDDEYLKKTCDRLAVMAERAEKSHSCIPEDRK